MEDKKEDYEDEKEEIENNGITNDEDLDVTEVSKRLIAFISSLLPNAILISEFNGNFVY